jgi:CheY-like chemotaxis protein
MDMPRWPQTDPTPTILLIEADPCRAGLLTQTLQAEGFAVAQACSVADAILWSRDYRADVIVIDPPPATSVARELNRLRCDLGTRGLPLIVIRRASSLRSANPIYAWPTTAAGEYDVLLEHVWGVVNLHVVQPASERKLASRSA